MENISKENLHLKLNQFLLEEFGLNISAEKIQELSKDNNRIILRYSRIFSIPERKIMYLRALQFSNVYSFDYRLGQKFEVDRRELNHNIRAEFKRLRNEIARTVLEDKKLILKLIKNLPIFTHYLGKFVVLITSLVNEDKIPNLKIQELIRQDENYKKYVNILIEMDFATYNENKDLVATNKTRMILKEAQNLDSPIQQTVNEILYSIIKDNLDYIARVLKLGLIKSLINVLSCVHFFTKYLKIAELREINLERFYRVHQILIGKAKKDRIDKFLTYLTYSGIISVDHSYNSVRLLTEFTKIPA